MSRLTPEMRRFVEAVAHDASIRTEYPRTQDEWRAAERLYVIATDLMSADAGAGEAQQLGEPRCAKCGGTGYYTDEAVDIEMLCPCREPASADRDAELERRLENLFLFAFMSGQDSSGITATSAAATEEAIKWRDDVLSHVRRREEAARGEERERCAEELDAMAAAWHDKRRFALEGAAKAIRNVRLVRVPEEAEHE